MDNENSLYELLNEISFVKCILFLVVIYLIVTGFSMIFNFSFDSLLFKICLYIPMLLFFIISLNYPSDLIKKDYNGLFNLTNFKKILFIILANFLFTIFIFFILRYMSTGLFRLDAQLFAYLDLNYPIYVLMYFLAVVILSPIVEELLFRGIILRKLNTDYNFSIPFAILISSLLFGLCHSFGGILSAFVFGICMSVLYLKTKNILVPILAHTLNNLISFILAFTRIEYYLISNGIIIIIVLILFVITNFILFKHIFNEISNLN